jgi:hypothetical protein
VRIKFYHPAGEHERYAPHAFDRLIGQEAPFKIEGAERGRATVIAVKVNEDGTGAEWTVDIAGGDPGKVAQAPGRFSFRLPDEE